MDLAVLDEILQSCSQEARKRLMDFMEALITANENKDEIIKQMEVERNEQEQQIQTISSDNQKLSVTVQEQNFLIQDLTSSNQNLKEQISQKVKQIEQMKAENKQVKKNAEENVANCKKMIAKNRLTVQDRVNAQIEKIREEVYIEVYNIFDKKLKRTQKFTVSSMSIIVIFCMCITGAWLSDHAGVFVGKTGVANFFISLWDGFISICNGTRNFLNSFVELLQGCTSLDVAQSIVYGISLLLVFGLIVLSILEGIPSMREKFKNIIRTYKNNEEFGYKKAMTIALCAIALFFAVLIAEYAMLNVIAMWLLLSLSFNLLYHLITYPRY